MLLTALFLAIAPRTIIFIIFVLVIFFGAKRIPELFRGLGQGVKEFKDASKEERPEYRDQQQPQQPHYGNQQPTQPPYRDQPAPPTNQNPTQPRY
ncbi:twin-arginine translocase TatA/TatE family subunit [Hymenobacter sp. NBH84]|uniref:Sec-independent protein translocase subunit TatA/TatB n=1 Tax=Hymenobacter sp. NBH84 TaxID=2596915 RepID=UPI0016289FE0|nr:twin-arginine translocase TatA/TatE family subunit [Hymenobacter sp. NBH84]QNE40817.1 twin-arginine translocase TatA/TatE family subunit [Hymenobacter sp. NBH84]